MPPPPPPPPPPPLPFELFHETFVNIMAAGGLIRCIAMQVISRHVIESRK